MKSMAKIVHSEAAPSEVVTYSLGGAAPFDLGGKTKSYETDDISVISDAEAHPWLTVKRDAAAPDQPADAPADDVQPTAIEAGLNQTTAVVTEGVAETLAADPTSKTKDKS